MTEQPHQVGGGRRAIGDVAPTLAALTDDVLFENIWNRRELAARDRSLITVAVLVAGGDVDQLRFHLAHAKNNGVTETELIEAITHLAFYAGWPKAMTAIGIGIADLHRLITTRAGQPALLSNRLEVRFRRWSRAVATDVPE